MKNVSTKWISFIKNSLQFPIKQEIRTIIRYSPRIHISMKPTIRFVILGFMRILIIKLRIDGRTINFHVHKTIYLACICTFLLFRGILPCRYVHVCRRKRRLIKIRCTFLRYTRLTMVLQRLIITRSNLSRNKKSKKHHTDYSCYSRRRKKKEKR